MLASYVIKHLRACGTRFADRVQGAADLFAVAELQNLEKPSLFVLPTAQQAAYRADGDTFDLTTTLALVAVVGATKDKRGQDAASQIDVIANELMGCLLNWCPDEEHGEGRFVSSAIQDFALQAVRLQYNFAWRRYGVQGARLGISRDVQAKWDQARTGVPSNVPIKIMNYGVTPDEGNRARRASCSCAQRWSDDPCCECGGDVGDPNHRP